LETPPQLYTTVASAASSFFTTSVFGQTRIFADELRLLQNAPSVAGHVIQDRIWPMALIAGVKNCPGVLQA
jgi:hypothetical protein